MNDNETDYNFSITSNQNQKRFPNCSTSSSIDSANSSSSLDSTNQNTTKKQLNTTLTVGSSTFHKVSSSSSPLSSSEFSNLKSELDLNKIDDYNPKKINLGDIERPHAKVDDFDFLKMIGKGSYGKVLLARHKKEHRFYAVKVLQKKMIIKRKEENHIMCERNVLLKNFDHPFLISLHYAFQTRDKLYFILEYANGGEVCVISLFYFILFIFFILLD